MDGTEKQTLENTPTKSRWSYHVLPETRPLGLIGPLKSYKWTFASGRRHRPIVMTWTRQMANGLPISDPVNAEYWELARRFFTACRNGVATGRPLALRSAIAATYNLFQVIDAVMRSGASSLWTFDRKGFDKMLLELTGRDQFNTETVFVRATVRARFEILRLLYAMIVEAKADGVALNDGFNFVTFSSSEEVMAMANQIGQQQGTTPDAPPEVVFPILNAATEYVVNFSDDIIALHQAVGKFRSDVEEQVKSEHSPRRNRASQIASVLLSSISTRPSWIADNGMILKSDLARQLGMNAPDIYNKRYQPLIKAAELLLSGCKSEEIEKARLFLIETSADKTSDYQHPPDASSKLALRIGLPFTGKSGEHAPWPIQLVGNSWGSKTGVSSVVNRLWTASYLILASFMADRISETLALETECLVYGIDGCYINTPNFKTRNVEGGTLILQPCPKIVELAVRTLQRLGETARARASSNKLLCVSHHMGSSVPDESELRKRILLFAEKTKTDSYRGKRWHLNPQQLRRFWVTTWANYYEFGRYFKALSTSLDHASLSTTIRYGARLVQNTAALSKSQRDLSNRILTKVALGDVFAKGPVAQNLVKFAERLRVRALPVDEMSEWVSERNNRNDVETFPMPHGYCVWSKLAGQHAGCLKSSERRPGIARPQTRKRACVCGNGCRNFFTTEAFAGFWEHARERHERIAANPAAPARYRAASKKAIDIAEAHGAKKQGALP